MNELKLILAYQIKIKFRENKTLFRNLYQALIPMLIVVGYMVFQIGRVIVANHEVVNLYHNQVFLGISMIMIGRILTAKKIPLEWHPASMVYFLGAKLRLTLKISLFKKGFLYAVSSILIALTLNNFNFSFQTLQMFMSLYNLLIISLMSRYFIYHEGLSHQKLGLILSYIMLLNFHLYINRYLGIILILFLTYISFLSIRQVLSTNINFDKSFKELVFINKVNYISREVMMGDMGELTRETQSEKYRNMGIFDAIRFRNPLNQKNFIAFVRTNLTVSIIIVTVLMIVIVLYRLGILELVGIIRESEFSIPIVVFSQTIFVMNIVRLISDQKDLLITKSRQGLYLPYKKHELLKSFLMLGAPILSVITLIVGLILQRSLWVIALASLLYSAFLLLSLCFKRGRCSMIREHLLMLIVFGISYLWIGLL